MTLDNYIKSRGLRMNLVAQQMGKTRQNLYNIKKGNCSTVRTLKSIAGAMTELGAPTTVAELVKALYGEEQA